MFFPSLLYIIILSPPSKRQKEKEGKKEGGKRNPTLSSVLSTLIYTPLLYFVKVPHFKFLFLCLFLAFSVSFPSRSRTPQRNSFCPFEKFGAFFPFCRRQKKLALSTVSFPYHSRTYKLLVELIICNVFSCNGCQVSNEK